MAVRVTVWLAFVIGCAFGAVVGALIAWRSFRDELAMREEWGREAREVLRPMLSWRDRDQLGYVAKVRRLLADEQGA